MKSFLHALVLGVYSISANAMLIDRGGGFIYDDVLGITWTQDANIDGFGGFRTWDNQVAWAADLSIVDTRPGAGGVTYSDWRLPSLDVNGDATIIFCSSATELACRDNEFGYMFFQNGVTAATPGLFINVESHPYWSGTELAGDPANAWSFAFDFNGEQLAGNKVGINFGWAVRLGDVAAIPVPAAVWLFGSALGLLGWIRRKAT